METEPRSCDPHSDTAQPVREAGATVEPPSRGSFFGALLRSAARMGQDVISLATGRPAPTAEPAELSGPGLPGAPPTPKNPEPARQKVGMLHSVAERLRGAADSYVAAKMDELEARVDLKLDEIEQRIDRKVLEFHEQLKLIRDQELRHRLRILKVTLAFTALVGVLSLVYKLVAKSL